MSQVKNVAVVGSGTMGNGIAHVFAQHDFHVALIDTSDQALKRGMATIGKNLDRQIRKGLLTDNDKQRTLTNIKTFSSIEDGVKNAELVVEAATENTDVKLGIFRELDQHAPPTAILATNTSSISITRIANATQRAEQVLGMHFMNPVPVMELVEVIRGYRTGQPTVDTVLSCCRLIGKVPVEVNDYPGFVANRILMPMINEAACSLYESVAGVAEIDTVMKLGMSHPMGPLQLADFIGLDVCLAILRELHDGFGNPKYAPCPLLVNMVEAGHLGVKTGVGFYEYDPDTKEKVVAARFRR
ncbi:MAG TPA: 3-hydroxyacyl-CoA dehydrogenase NAD-binding domain-containing protein [Cyclobacteriaceae bacterium]|nr:3-hydroxyacyl-CoA dehydrogenase NAD-binding domain-containing protein [Cyclobacteriaceae bacterium]